MPRPPKLFFSDRNELPRLLSRLKVLKPESKRARGRPYDPEDIEQCASWNADKESGRTWPQIAKERLPGVPAAVERIKQGVRRYRAFCTVQGIEPGALLNRSAPLEWADEWSNSAMAKAKVGDIVWYVLNDAKQLAKITGVSGRTHCIIRLLSGPQSRQELEAPWGMIQAVETKAMEHYRNYAIEVILQPLEDGTLTAHGFIPKPHPYGSGLPFETSFKIGERHTTEDETLRAAIVFAKKKIDDFMVIRAQS